LSGIGVGRTGRWRRVRDYRRREAEKARAFDLEGRLNRVLENVVEPDDPRWRAINVSEPRVRSLKT
jgi:hypothetical protein